MADTPICECPKPGLCLCWLYAEGEDCADRNFMDVRVMVAGSLPNGQASVDIEGYIDGRSETIRHVSDRQLRGPHTIWKESIDG